MSIKSTTLLSFLILTVSFNTQAKEKDENDSYGRYESAPLAPELRETYRKGQKHGNATGTFVNTLLCDGFNWSWFCKGENK